jgi:hypothetical protein
MQNFVDYKSKVDPDGRFNKGQAHARRRSAQSVPSTPRFALTRPQELDHGAEGNRQYPDSIKDSLRRGKCKPVRATHRAARQPALQSAPQNPRHIANRQSIL